MCNYIPDMRQYVTPDNPLSRYYKFPPIPFHDGLANSIQLMYCTVQLTQHGRYHDAHVVLLRDQFKNHPSNVGTWTFKRIGHRRKAESVYMAQRIYYAIMRHLLQTGGSPFHQKFVELSNQYPNDELEFIDTNNAGADGMVWSCGLRQRTARNCPRSRFPGSNLHGESLKRLFTEFKSGVFNGPLNYFTVEELLAPDALPIGSYSKTILLLSDSQCRQVKAIDGGTVIPNGGAKYRDIADTIKQKRIHFQDYQTVIIVCGVNDAQHGEDGWRASWEPLRDQLMQIHNCPDTTLIFNSPVFTSKKMLVPEHTAWIKREFERDFNADRFVFRDWVTIHPENVFRSGNGLVARYYRDDGLHVNHAGFRQLWDDWGHWANGISEVPYQMSDRFYQQHQ